MLENFDFFIVALATTLVDATRWLPKFTFNSKLEYVNPPMVPSEGPQDQLIEGFGNVVFGEPQRQVPFNCPQNWKRGVT